MKRSLLNVYCDTLKAEKRVKTPFFIFPNFQNELLTGRESKEIKGYFVAH